MTAIKTIIDARAKLWTPGEPLPRHLAFVAKDRLAIATDGAQLAAVDPQRMTATGVISTIDRDRVGDEVVPEGCDLTRYALNPVVFFGHQQFPLPIGKAMDPSGRLTVVVEPGKRVLATTWFSQSNPEAVQIFALIAEKMLPGISIGFNPLEEPEKLGEVPGNLYAGFRFNKWELLEYSHVGLPCNPYATLLRGVLSKGMIGGERLRPLVSKALAPLAEPRKAWSPGFTTKGKRPMSKKDGLNESGGTEGGYAVPEGLSLLRVRCLKDVYPDRPDAEAKVSGLGYEVDDYEETDDSHDFHQERLAALDGDPSEDEVENGIRAVVGKRKAEAADEDDLESHEPPDRKPAADEAAKRGKPRTKQGPLPADGGAGLGGEVDEEITESLPQGAACAQFVIDYVQGQLPKLEPEVKEVFEDVANLLIKWAQDRYPDVEFGAAESEPAEELSAEEAAEDEAAMTDEVMERYRQGQVGLAKLLARVLHKRLSKRHKAVVREAADHLEDMSTIEAGSPFTRTHKTACRAHHSAMKGLLRDLESGLEDEDEPVDDKAADLDVEAITKKLDGLEGRRSTLDQAFYRLTGKRAE